MHHVAFGKRCRIIGGADFLEEIRYLIMIDEHTKYAVPIAHIPIPLIIFIITGMSMLFNLNVMIFTIAFCRLSITINLPSALKLSTVMKCAIVVHYQTYQIRLMIRDTRIYKALRGTRIHAY